MSGISQQIKDLVNNGIELLEKGLGTTMESMLIQLVSTIILFLAIRYFFWNKITAIIEERKSMIEEGLKAKDDALAESVLIQNENKEIKEKARLEARDIVENSKTRAQYESEQIINQAKDKAKDEINRAKGAIEVEKRKAENQIQKEIIDNAFLLSEKIIGKELDQTKHQELVDDFIAQLGNEPHA